jgi:hypothetical protein
MNLTLSMLFQLWLSGSLVLPFMVLLRWAGANWRGLRWLTRDRKRWISVWASFGFYKTIAFAALMWVGTSFYVGLDFLGWSGSVVSRVLPGHLTRMLTYTSTCWLVASLSALLDAVIYSGFGATAWWAFDWKTRKALGRLGWARSERYCVALLLSACLMGIANDAHSWLEVPSGDIYMPEGFPFTYCYAGGFAGIRHYVWKGLIGDALVILLSGAILGWGWNWFSRKYSTVNRTTI